MVADYDKGSNNNDNSGVNNNRNSFANDDDNKDFSDDDKTVRDAYFESLHHSMSASRRSVVRRMPSRKMPS